MRIDRIGDVACWCKGAGIAFRAKEDATIRRLDNVKWAMPEEWSRTTRAPKHAAFLHEREFKP